MANTGIRKVHVIFKTHLDIGYTDLSSVVLEKYRTEYIPRALRIARELNTDGRREFVWTVGSFLLDDYLSHADPQQTAELDEAVRRGDIAWHGLATTTHTELLDPELLRFDLSLAQALDRRYGRHTIAAKMTDVPGHTIGLVPALCAAGIEYLHIGVNCGSPMPRVPELFRWVCGDHEVIVHYSDDYGKPLTIDGFDEAIEIAYTGDNTGPQNADKIRRLMADLRKKYPGAEVVASTLDDFAAALRPIRDRLPVVREEIGDTWIHGCGTDPVKIGLYEDLLRLKTEWLADGSLSPEQPYYHRFMTDLLLIAEHTCSVDIKKYLFDLTNWDKGSFRAARAKDKTDISLLGDQRGTLHEVVQHELDIFRGGDTTGSYSLYERAQAEQMAYLDDAIASLPPALRIEAERCRTARRAFPAPLCPDLSLLPGQDLTFGRWTCRVAADGSLSYLRCGDRLLADAALGEETIARPLYDVYDALTVRASQYRYNVRLDKGLAWTEADFCKPGLERVPDLRRTTCGFALAGMAAQGSTLSLRLVGDADACERYGCPREMRLTYTFGDDLTVDLAWTRKDASRIPEAIWLGFCPHAENPHRWRMQKLGVSVSPYDVVSMGNRQLHIVREWRYDGADGALTLRALHAPLCAVGGRGLYRLDDRVPSLEHGMWYALFNNRWGTNYKTWCEDDASFTFTLSCR